MFKLQYNHTIGLIERRRFQLLLVATLLVIFLPAYSGRGLLSNVLFMVSMSFLLIQSMIAADVKKSKKNFTLAFVVVMIVMLALKTAGIENVIFAVIKLALIALFFIFIVTYLFRYIINSTSVNISVLIASVNIYLLLGIISGSLAFVHYSISSEAYNFPENIGVPAFPDFLYYSYITMSTVGYGDITPARPETQTLSYLISVTGQLYVAIIIAFLVGKLLVTQDAQKTDKPDHPYEN